jgi:hypothetical protein
MVYIMKNSINTLYISTLKRFGHDRYVNNCSYFYLLMQLISLGHSAKCGAKKGLKAVTRPANLVIAGVALKTLLSSFDAKAQQYNPQGDTLWGTGIFQTINEENNNFIGNVLLSLRPESMAMHTPDTTYKYTTNNSGGVEFNLPVYIDSTTGINDLIESKVHVVPTIGSELNAFFPTVQKGSIEMYNLNGQLVEQQDFNTDHKYLTLNTLTPGMYIYAIQTEKGINLSGKFIKQNTPLQGPSSRPQEVSSSSVNKKNLYTATYWAKWEHPDFFTDSVLITLEEGWNGPKNFFMTSSIPPPIDNQDISGIVVDPNNNYAALANASIEVYIPSTNQLFTTVSESDGSFRIDGLPLGKEAYFSAGDLAGKGSIVDFPFNTIEEVINPSDSVNANFGTVLPDNVPTSSWEHIRQQNDHGTNQEIIKYYFDNNNPNPFTPSQMDEMRGFFSQLQSDENNSYIFIESSTPLNDEGITIEKGNYNTNTTAQGFVTPLGNILNPVKYAESEMGVGSYITFVHEIKRALGYNEVAWYSVMKATAPDFTLEDKDIAREVSAMYWNAVYQDEKTYMPIQFMQENMSKSVGAKAKASGEIKQEINQYKNGVGFSFE